MPAATVLCCFLQLRIRMAPAMSLDSISLSAQSHSASADVVPQVVLTELCADNFRPVESYNSHGNETESVQIRRSMITVKGLSSGFKEFRKMDSSSPCVSQAPLPPPSPPPTPRRPQCRTKRSIFDAHSCKNASSECVPTCQVEMWDYLFFNPTHADVEILIEGGGILAAHAAVLVASSPVMSARFEKVRVWPCSISMMGVPQAAARVFVRFLYSSRVGQEDMEKYAVHLLVLSHAYCVPSMKRTCTVFFEQGLLTRENIMDVYQLALLCDAPRLELLCFRNIIRDFRLVTQTEGWKVMCESNRELKEELIEAVVEAETRRRERLRKTENDKVYEQLHGAVEALVHICRDGCHGIGPCGTPVDTEVKREAYSYCGFPACVGLSALVWHFARCKLRVDGACKQCKHMWQLLELHSRMCEEVENCKVPLCRHFRENFGERRSKKAAMRWQLLVNRVVSARRSCRSFSSSPLVASVISSY